MLNKSFPKLFGIIVDVFREVEHDGEPDVIRSNLDVSMVHISFVKRFKETVTVSIFKRAALLVAENLILSFLFPNIRSIFVFVVILFFPLEVLNRNSFEPLVTRFRQ